TRDGELPCTVLVLDEVQQFINSDANTALEVQEVVEACSSRFDGRLLVVGTGQSALTDTPALQRLLGRFAIKVHLKDNDVEKVIRTIVLQKKENKKRDIDQMVSRHSGEIARQLNGTKIATRQDDDQAYVADYPLLPVRRRFWGHVLHSTDPSGTAAQMRTQLRVTHEACRSVANKELGAVVPADFLYEQLANDLVMSGEMQKRFQEIIEEQRTKTDGSLRSRICALVFLIGKLPRQGADIGVRATVDHLGDLLTDDLGSAAAKLRQKLPALVQELVNAGVLMEIDGELQLQTTEGAAWEAEYRSRRSALLANDTQLAAHRSQLLSKAIRDELSGISVLHGTAREKRKVVIHHSMEAPSAGDGVAVWVRDGFQESENSIVQDVQRRNVEDATIHVVIPKSKSDELRNAIAASVAAEETVNFRGNPASQEGKDARAAIVSRQVHEETKIQELLADVLNQSRVFLSGGQELPPGITLEAAVEDAAPQVLDRLYPRFRVADSSNWPTVWKRAKEGNAAALSALGYQGDPEKHPVAAELLTFIGAGKKGNEVVSKFTSTPFGWPKDAVDAALATLVVSGHLGVKIHGQPVRLADLDQRRVGQADFRVEHPVLTASQKLRIKKLFQHAGHPFQAGDEAVAAPGFIALMKHLGQAAGGEPPAPEPPYVPDLIELDGLRGNDLMASLFEKADDLTHRVDAWRDLAVEIKSLTAQFTLTKRLLDHAAGLPDIPTDRESLEAVTVNRSLLDDPDPVRPLLASVASKLRSSLQEAYSDYEDVFLRQRARLEAHPVWVALDAATRSLLLAPIEAAMRGKPAIGTDTELLAALDGCDLKTWRTLTDALPTRFDQVLAAAI
ncbi:MAG: BREX system P-loop protein BrxC, partial [Candidatus Atribacteria bacterium]|nr:BREX system P-loop protein BrxC [Candidatus Atribacteria bacterium]